MSNHNTHNARNILTVRMLRISNYLTVFYLITKWKKVRLEKLAQLVNKLAAPYRTQDSLL
jgi:hypothetical protein